MHGRSTATDTLWYDFTNPSDNYWHTLLVPIMFRACCVWCLPFKHIWFCLCFFLYFQPFIKRMGEGGVLAMMWPAAVIDMTETVQAKEHIFMVEKWLKLQPTLMTSLFTSSVGTEICSWLSKDDFSPICIDEIWWKMDPPEKKLLPYLTSINCYESCCKALDIASLIYT